MIRPKLALVVTVLACLIFPVYSQAASPRAYVKIVGSKQGIFKGEAVRVAGNNYIPLLRFTYGVNAPRDASTGLPTGKRQHLPLVITKVLDSTSPQILEAMVTNEPLTEVTIEFITTSTDGKELAYYVITLTNATIVDLHQHMDQVEPTAAGSPPASTDPMEDVSFVYEKITVESKVGQTTASDLWTVVQP